MSDSVYPGLLRYPQCGNNVTTTLFRGLNQVISMNILFQPGRGCTDIITMVCSLDLQTLIDNQVWLEMVWLNAFQSICQTQMSKIQGFVSGDHSSWVLYIVFVFCLWQCCGE